MQSTFLALPQHTKSGLSFTHSHTYSSPNAPINPNDVKSNWLIGSLNETKFFVFEYISFMFSSEQLYKLLIALEPK